ncbi:MAG TPA: alpha-L-fucosidase [Desulfuromonadaceae bacterium]|nr:alpha-L-fucosidase [Desulfuromonadaceae bacterium]
MNKRQVSRGAGSLMLALLLTTTSAFSQSLTNRAERLDWFRDQGFGLFIHWSVDSQLGYVISHTLVGASDDYVNRFYGELPKTFNPHKFNATELAALARLAGVRYVVFTAKHHSGFCMWDTATTDLNIMHTPFQRDVTSELLSAFRAQGIAPGLYFSPDDFWWLHRNNKVIQRKSADVQPLNNPGLLQYDLAQVRELMTKYGDIKVVFFDGQADQLRDLAWQLQPDTVVTRGAIQTPEKTIPGKAIDAPWESCITMGDGWQYQPTLENYKSAGQLIQMLIETRAKGGNLLLNVGPKPDGELPVEQEERLREIAEWMFINGEAIYGVRPWSVVNERDVWFTKKKDEDTVYAFVHQNAPWKLGAAADVVLASVHSSGQTAVSVLGQNDKALEYSDVVPRTTWKQEPDGLHIHFFQAQRLRDNRQWSNPVVLKITHASPATGQAVVETVGAKWDAAGVTRLEGNLREPGNDSEVQAGFEYRDITGQDADERTSSWQPTRLTTLKAAGAFVAEVPGLKAGDRYEFRAIVRSGAQTGYGREMEFSAK